MIKSAFVCNGVFMVANSARLMTVEILIMSKEDRHWETDIFTPVCHSLATNPSTEVPKTYLSEYYETTFEWFVLRNIERLEA